MAQKKKNSSIIDEFKDRPEDFIGYAWEVNPDIKDISDFHEALIEKFNSARGENARMGSVDEYDLKDLWNHPLNKDKLRENLSEEEFNEMFEGIKRETPIISEAQRKSSELIAKSQRKKAKLRANKQRRRESRQIRVVGNNTRYLNDEQFRYISVRVQRGIKKKQIFTDFNKEFPTMKRRKKYVYGVIYRTRAGKDTSSYRAKK